MCEEIANRMGLKDAGPYTIPVFSDAIAFHSRGVPGIALASLKIASVATLSGDFMGTYMMCRKLHPHL